MLEFVGDLPFSQKATHNGICGGRSEMTFKNFFLSIENSATRNGDAVVLSYFLFYSESSRPS